MKTIFLILLTIFLTSCRDSDDTNAQLDNIDAGLEFSLKNTENKDLLDPNNPDHWDSSLFKIFYLINGEKQEVYFPNSDYPNGYNIYKQENEYRIAIFLNHSESEEKATTYVQWNNQDTDTIQASYDRTSYGVLQNTIWLNGIKVWERGNNTIDPYFVLTK